jgi:hypothetical protein
MSKNTIDPEKIESNWSTFESLCDRFKDEGLNQLLAEMGQRLAECPFSPRLDGPGCHPGGLIEVTLRVTSLMRKLNDSLDEKVSVPSLLKVGLLHDLGKVGDESQDHFLEQDSDWHRDKLGQLYKYNETLPKMGYAHRTLWLLQHYGVTLTRDEWEAIFTSGGLHLEENRFYSGTKSSLTRILCAARLLAL